MQLTADGEDCGVVGIRYYQCKLGTCMPSLWGHLWVIVIKVDRDGVIGRCIRIAERE